MNFSTPWPALGLLLDQHGLLARLVFASVELAVLALAATLVLKLARPRTPRLTALVWALVLAKPLATLILGSPWPVVQLLIPVAQNVQRTPVSPDMARTDADRIAHHPLASSSPDDSLIDHQDLASDAARPVTDQVARHPASALNQPSPAAASFPWWSLVTGLWLAGVGVMLIRATWIRRRLASILAAAQIPSDEVQQLYAQIAASLGLNKKTPPLLVTTALESPALVGLWKSTILVPAWLAEKTDRAALAWSLRHELTHWKQGDLWFIRLRELAGLAFYFHPGVWWASRRMEEALEIACDRAVIASNAEAADYAGRLYQILEAVRQQRGRPITTGLFATRSQIAKRLVMLLESPLRLRPKLSWKAAIGMGLLAAAVLAVGIGLRPEAVAQDKPSATKPADQNPAAQPADKPAANSQADDLSSDKTRDANKSANQQPEENATVEGMVVDETGKPVAGATVRYFLATKEQPPLTTDAQGSYRFFVQLTHPDDIHYATSTALVADDAANHRQGYAYIAVGATNKQGKVKSIVLKPLRQTTIKVVDAQGAPVLGATYSAPGCKFYLGDILFTGVTDAQGEAKLQYTEDTLVHQIIALKSGVGFDYFISPLASSGTGMNAVFSRDAKLGQPLPAELTLHLDGARTLKCVATTSDGKGVPNAIFGPYAIKLLGKAAGLNSACRAMEIATDASGVAVFDWLPRNFVDQMRFSCGERGYTMLRDSDAPDPLVLHAKDPVDELHAMLARPAKITGHVYLPDGSPAAGIRIERQDAKGVVSNPARIHTKADGSFETVVQLYGAGDHPLRVGVEDDRWAAPAQWISVTDNSQINLDFKLVEGTIVRGTVSEMPDNKPLAKAMVRLVEIDNKTNSADKTAASAIPALSEHSALSTANNSADSGREPTGFSRQATTDVDGHFRFCVVPGNYVLFIPQTSQPISHTHHSNFTIDKEREVVVDFQLPQLETGDLQHLAGKVIDPDGKPVAGATITAPYVEVLDRFVGSLKAKTAADGTFEFDRVKAIILIEAMVSPTSPLAGARLVRPDEKEIEIQLQHVVEGHGKLLDEHGQPVPATQGNIEYGIRVPSTMEAANTGDALFPEPDGSYTLKDLIPGIGYGVYFRSKGSDSASRLATFTPEKGKPTELGDTRLPGTPLKTSEKAATPKTD